MPPDGPGVFGHLSSIDSLGDSRHEFFGNLSWLFSMIWWVKQAPGDARGNMGCWHIFSRENCSNCSRMISLRDRLNVATHVLQCINFKSITFLNTKHGLKMVTADGGLDSVIDGRWRLARVDGTKSQGQRAKKSCTITGPKTTQKGKVFSRGILHQTYLVSEKSRLVKQKIHPQDAIGLDVLPSNLLQPWFYLSVLYSEKLLLDVTRWWTKATDLMCTSWASNNKGQIQYTTKATLCNTNIHNEPLHKMRDYKSWPNLRVCIFKISWSNFRLEDSCLDWCA